MNQATVRLGFIFAVGILTFAGSRSAEASDQVVSDCGDNGGIHQLRAVLNAVQSGGGGTITFSCGPTIILNVADGSLPNITTNITIDGGHTITLSGNNASRLFVVDSGASLTLNNIILTKGYAASGDGGAIYANGTLNVNGSKFLDNQTSLNGNGGAIVSFGVLNISNSEFANNKAASGGALYPTGGAAVTTITHSDFHDNWAIGTTYGWGGAIYMSAGASVTIHSSTLSTNHAKTGGAIYAYHTANLSLLTINDHSLLYWNQANFGGGIYLDVAEAVLTGITLSGNTAITGGGIDIGEFSAATLTNVTLSGNQTSGYGGGIANYGTANLTNVTLSGNQGTIDGGGFWNSNGSAFLINVTLSGNTVDAAVGKGGVISNNGPLTLVNTLIAKGTSGANCYGVSGGDFSLSDDGSCGFGAGRDNVDLLLGPLADNGGWTLTHMPLPGSPAIDGGNGSWCPSTDQRGASRVGSACDVGSVEFGGHFPKLYLPFIRR